MKSVATPRMTNGARKAAAFIGGRMLVDRPAAGCRRRFTGRARTPRLTSRPHLGLHGNPNPSDPSPAGDNGSLKILAEGGENPYVLRAEGELDMSNVELFEESLRAAEATGAPHIVVDLNGLSFMDSAGLRVLLMSSRRVRRESRRLSVRATGGVRRIIELTGMASYLALPEGT